MAIDVPRGFRLAGVSCGIKREARKLDLTLIVSDVPGDDPATIASGPTAPDPTTAADAPPLPVMMTFSSNVDRRL